MSGVSNGGGVSGTPKRRLTLKQQRALDMLRNGARYEDTWTGVVATETFWDAEVKVANIHWKTARSLIRRDLIRYGERDPEWGTEILLRD